MSAPNSQSVDRGEAVNLASNIISRADTGSYKAIVTDKGVKCLVEAVLLMDEALRAQQDGPADCAAFIEQFDAYVTARAELRKAPEGSDGERSSLDRCIHDWDLLRAWRAALSNATDRREG